MFTEEQLEKGVGLPTAAECRKAIDEGEFRKGKEQLEKLTNAIVKAVAEGKVHNRSSDNPTEAILHPSIKRILENKGYQVAQYPSMRNEPGGWNISW